MAARYSIKGGDKLLRHLKSLPREATEETRQTIKRQAAKLTEEVRAAAPRGKTGALKAGIRARFSQKGLVARVGIFGARSERKAARAAVLMRAGLKKGKAMRLANAAERDPYYARFVEFGTQKMAAKPFLYPAFRSKRQAFRGEIVQSVTRTLKKAR